MVYLKRFLYLIYYIRETDFRQIGNFARHASKATGLSGVRIYLDVLRSVFLYNIAIKDYFCFRFYELSPDDRKNWAGTGFMYEYQLKMNPKNSREVLENKIKFLRHFRSFVRRDFATLDEIKGDKERAFGLLQNRSGRLVLKGSLGQVGAEVEVIKCSDFTPESLTAYMKQKGYDLIEEYVVQHPLLMELSPSALNTVRIFTQMNYGEVDFLGARLRVSVNSPVDNMAAGNLAAPVDIVTGIVTGPAVFSDITKEEKRIHPVTGKKIEGFTVPYWKEVTELARSAAKDTPENQSVGWDIAITPNGPELIEGNHNWCKLLWQMPVRRGLKPELEKYL